MFQFTTRISTGNSYKIQARAGAQDDQLDLLVTNLETLTQDHGIFAVQDDALFGCGGLEFTDSFDVGVIANEVAQIMEEDENDTYFSPYDLCDSKTNQSIRKATWHEARVSASDSVEGHIVVGTTLCYVQMREAQRQELLGEKVIQKVYKIYCTDCASASNLAQTLTVNNGFSTTSDKIIFLTVDNRIDGGWDFNYLEQFLDNDDVVVEYQVNESN